MNTKHNETAVFLAKILMMVFCFFVGCLLAGRMPSLIPVLAFVLVGCATYPLALWLRRRIRTKAIADHLRCGACGYNLTGHQAVIDRTDVKCPECGGSLQEVGVVKEGRPHPEEMRQSTKKLNLIGAICGLLSIAVLAPVLIGNGKLGGQLWVLVVVATCILLPFATTCWRQRGGKR